MKKTPLAMLAPVLTLFILTLAACGGGASGTAASTTEAPATTAPANTSQPAAGQEDRILSAEELKNHEIYTYAPTDNALNGIGASIQNDRSAIYKALDNVEQKSDVVVGWSEAAMVSAFFAGLKQGAEQFCGEYGYELKYLVANDFDSNKQSSDIEALITQGVDIIVINPVDYQAQIVDVQKAVDAGIPVISVVPFEESVPVITTISPIDYNGAFLAGQYAAKMYEDPIDIVMIAGVLGHAVTNPRMNGMLAGWVYGKQEMAGTAKPYWEDAMLEGYNYYLELVRTGKVDMSKYDAQILGIADGNWEDAAGMTATENLLTAHPTVSLILSENDQMGAGSVKVLEQRGLSDQIKIVTPADGDTSALKLVADGKLVSTGYNNPIAISKAVVTFIHMIFEEGFDANNMPRITPMPLRLFTKDNYTEVYEEGTVYSKVIDIDYQTIDEINAAVLAG
ncbi:MAG: sugar ABC transporter substrate-binding protein [Peptococcaceae bacterium]|jgi:ribose transport system substrate-binding protein|nr:sugar ABC transporter substrate-binding protein [Peptococcaceae bacterium]